MAELQIACFGDLQVKLAQTVLKTFPTDKARALLAYLASEGQAHQRTELAQFFWSGYSAESARNSLRQTIHQLRQLLWDDEADPPWLLLTRQTVQFNPAASIRSDVQDFTQLLAACTAHTHAALTTCATCLARLRQAAELYQGDFLAGLPVIDSSPFEEWRRLRQEQLRLQVLDSLNQLAIAAERTGDAASALWVAQRQVAIEPWLEAAHRQIMRILAEQGEQAAALAQYQRCQQVLSETWGAAPDAETAALYEEIVWGAGGRGQGAEGRGQKPEDSEQKPEGRGQKPEDSEQKPEGAQEHAVGMALHSRLDWGEMPAVDFFAGRAAEVAQLTAWLAPTAPTRIVSVLGMGGIGKTTLAAAVAKAVAPQFAVVIWRSLLNAPPLNELLRNWLQILSRQTLSTLPGSLDEQLRLLVAHLRQERCLLVLDNVESIFTAGDPQGQAGAPRPGYEGYDQLLQRLASSDHQSCLLLTSREQPYALVRLGRQAQETTGRLRVLPLAGLDEQAGYTLLQTNGLDASAQDAARLVQSYSGNPLALQIVAGAIADFFGGDVAAFTQEAGGLFDGIRLVLDQQFARLSPLEREILVWLAVEREAITVPTLRSNFVQPVATAPLLEALQALQNRSLLEKRDAGFTLQNVIIEYTTEYLLEQMEQELTATPGIEPSRLAAAFFNRFTLQKAQAKEYVRQSQQRLIIQPLAERLQAQWGKTALATKLKAQLLLLHAAPPRARGYAAGNLLTLLRHWQIDCTGYDFSRLAVWGVDFRGARMSDVNFAEADLAFCTFTLTIKGFAIKLRADEELLVGDMDEGDVRLWVLTGNRTLTEAHHWRSNGAYPLVFNDPSAGAPLLLTGAGIDCAIRVWSVADQTLLYTLRGHRDRITTLAINPAGTLLASSSGDQTLYLWDLRSGQLLQRVDGQHGTINALVFAPPNGGQPFGPSAGVLFSGDQDGVLQRWEIKNGQLCHTWSVQSSRINTLAMAPQHALLVSGHVDSSIQLWDGQTGQLLARLTGHANRVTVLAFQAQPSPGLEDLQLLASGGADHTVLLWAVQRDGRHQLLYRFLGHGDEVAHLSFSPDGKRLASASAERCVRLWATQTGRPLETLLGHLDMIGALRFSPDGRLVASGSGDGLVRLWAVSEHGPAQHAPTIVRYCAGHVGRIQALAFSPDGRLLASAGADQIINLWDTQSGRLLQTLAGHTGAVLQLAFHPTQPLLASSGADHTIRLWAQQGQNWGMAQNHIWRGHQAAVTALAFYPNGATLVSGSEDDTLRLWNVAQGSMCAVLRGHTASVTGVAVSADGQLIASSSFDNTMRLWRADNGDELLVRSGDRLGGRAIAIAANSELLAYGAEEISIEVWNARTQQVVHTLRGHTSSVVALDFSPVAPLLVSGGWDGALRLWGLESGQCLASLRPPGPYAGMNMRGVTGISEAQRASLTALGAVAA